jgi:hypothetical protein
MSHRLLFYSVVAGVALATCCFLSERGAAQSEPAQRAGGAGNSPPAAAPIARTADGHPDFAGLWTGHRGGDAGDGNPPLDAQDVVFVYQSRSLDTANATTKRADGSGNSNPEVFNEDNTIILRMGTNRPLYKPRYWLEVQENDQTGNTADPVFRCLPEGVPRMGPPQKIVETPAEMIFLYPDTYRVIFMDGRQHTPKAEVEPSWKGESLGKWVEDTLVIDTVGFSDESWLDITGYIHGENMHVIETMRRNGDKITWQATVEDPDFLLEPWVMNPRTITLNPDPKAVLAEPLPCVELDAAHLVGNEHH